jgi:quinol monooxygenase YgiN
MEKPMTSILIKSTVAAALIAVTATTAFAESPSSEIQLTYVWTAHEGQAERLVATYAAVGEILEANEPGLLFYEIAVSESGNQLIINETFADSDAMAFHLTETAAQFFPQLVTVATPGPFIFRGDVPEELKAAAYGMNMGAIFTNDWEGFERE